MLKALGLLGSILLCTGIYIAKRELKMKEQGKGNFKIYAFGGTVMMPLGVILLLYWICEALFNFVL